MGIMSLEESRERNLKALGKSKDWYDSKFKDQNGACAVCRRPQNKIGLDGKPRPLVANVAGDCLLCARCSARQNKQNQRQRDNEYKRLKAQKSQGPQTLQEFWRKNRNGLPEAEKVAHENRDGEIINFTCSINAWMAEENLDDDGLECLRASIREFCEEIQRHGTVETGHIDWQDDTKKFQSAGDALYFRFGYYAALPADLAGRFIEFAERSLSIDPYPYSAYGGFGYLGKRIDRLLATLDGKEYIDPDLTTKCSTPGCRANTTRAIGEILPPQWWCGTCQIERDKAAHAALIRIRERQALAQHTPGPVTTAPTRGTDREHEVIFGEDGRYGG